MGLRSHPMPDDLRLSSSYLPVVFFSRSVAVSSVCLSFLLSLVLPLRFVVVSGKWGLYCLYYRSSPTGVTCRRPSTTSHHNCSVRDSVYAMLLAEDSIPSKEKGVPCDGHGRLTDRPKAGRNFHEHSSSCDDGHKSSPCCWRNRHLPSADVRLKI